MAQFVAVLFVDGILLTDALNFKMWRFKIAVGQNHNAQVVALLNIVNFATLFVQQKSAYRERSDRTYFCAEFFLCFIFNQAEDGQRQ